MITSIQAMLNIYKQIDTVKDVPVFLGVAPAGTPEPYCVYSQIPSGASGIQGAYGDPGLTESPVWQWAFYEVGKDASNMAKSLVLAEAFKAALQGVRKLTLVGGTDINISLRRVSEIITNPVDVDAKTGKQRFQSLVKYELINQEQ